MPTISFLWHLHQPAYRTADGVVHAPWVALHAGGAYMTLARAILETGSRGQVLNVVPTLLEQLVAYRDDGASDPVAAALCRPASELDRTERAIVVDWSRHASRRHVQRSPRLGVLLERVARDADPGRAATRLGAAGLRDLQVLLILAHAGDQAWRDPRLEPLSVKGLRFDDREHRVAVDWFRRQPGELVEAWRDLARRDGVEIATSPYAHPIMPLLIDASVARTSRAANPPRDLPDFRRPADARLQLAAGLGFMADHGFGPVGCWPPEGAVSAAALETYAEAGVAWLVTDEEILSRSLGIELRTNGVAAPELYRPWRLATGSPVVFFRDRELSDRIGFSYGRWDDEQAAADDLVARLADLSRELPGDAAIVIALDGENPWPHYAACGGVFLRRLMSRLQDLGRDLTPATLTEVAARVRPLELRRLHPGSWIGASFATWIGHPEKSAAWRLMAAVRDALPEGQPVPPSMVLAEGSDWFWWLGDDNPTELAPLYDEIFRRHLADACDQAGIAPPVDLDRPIRQDG